MVVVTITVHPGSKPSNVGRPEAALAGNKKILYTWKYSLPATEVVCSDWTKAQTVPSRDGLANRVCRHSNVDRYTPRWRRSISSSMLHEREEVSKRTECISFVDLLRRICSRTFSVRLRLFPSVLRPSITFFPTILSFSVPFRPIRVRVMFPSSPSHLFQPSTLGSDPFSVSSDLALYNFRYCSAIAPISPTPSHPVFLLSSVPYCFMIRSFLLFRCV